MKLTFILVFLSTSTGAIGSAIKNDENVSRRQAQSYNLHLKPPAGGVKAQSCLDHYKQGQRFSDIYQINPDGKGSFAVMCDMIEKGWIVFQHRYDGLLDFFRGWKDYRDGFGSLLGEFWLGLEKIHRITASRNYKLRIDLEDFEGNKRFADYSLFRVGNEREWYLLKIGSYSGNAGDSMSYHNGAYFTTKDSDHDHSHWVNCAQRYHGAWWYKTCHYSNLNGFYYRGGKHSSYADGINWYHWKGHYYSMKTVTMKIKEI